MVSILVGVVEYRRWHLHYHDRYSTTPLGMRTGIKWVAGFSDWWLLEPYFSAHESIFRLFKYGN